MSLKFFIIKFFLIIKLNLIGPDLIKLFIIYKIYL